MVDGEVVTDVRSSARPQADTTRFGDLSFYSVMHGCMLVHAHTRCARCGGQPEAVLQRVQMSRAGIVRAAVKALARDPVVHVSGDDGLHRIVVHLPDMIDPRVQSVALARVYRGKRPDGLADEQVRLTVLARVDAGADAGRRGFLRLKSVMDRFAASSACADTRKLSV